MGKRGKDRLRAWIILLLLGGPILAVFAYALDSAYEVTSRMTGRTWELPSRLYSAAPVLYPGSTYPEESLCAYLRRLGYQPTRRRPVETGLFSAVPGEVEIGLRAFRDLSGDRAAERIVVRYSDKQITRIEKGDGGEELFTVGLEPEPLGEFFNSKRQERTLVRLSEVPQPLRDGVILMEDRFFYQHHGLSLRGTLRALWTDFRGMRVVQGGSTLTQQLMKNFFLKPDRTLSRKVREAIMTLVAETLYSKDQIFEAYVNEIYLGQQGPASIHGFGEASKFYFGKPLALTTLGEQALLVGLISSPGQFSPYNSIERARARRDLVLKLLLAQEKITNEAFASALRERIEPRGKLGTPDRAPYFIDFARRELSERFSTDQLTQDGLRVFTNLDVDLQEAAAISVTEMTKHLEARVRKLMKGIDPSKHLQAALVALQPQTGVIKAFVGGRDYADSQFNRAILAVRQPGSAVKPFVVAAALSPKDGGTPAATAATLLDDRLTTFAFSGREWSPRNYEGQYLGEATVRTALEKSLNTATVNLAIRTGLPSVVELMRKAGFENVSELPSAVLGTIEVTPLSLARAYTPFLNGGLRSEPIGISAVVDASGHRLDQRSGKVERVLSEEVSFLVTNLLRGVIDRGTAASARKAGLDGDLAGKTGTTDEGKDSWFVGFSPSLLTVVWVGFDDGTPTHLTGASGALQLWIRFMQKSRRFLATDSFHVPRAIVWKEIRREKGCVGSGEQLREAFLPGTEPSKCR
ncbi:MAG: PBP1A family penicillin-binding protein [Pseudomonadota bacterium]